MKVELTNEWLGHAVGSVIEVRNEKLADEMIANGKAKEVKDTRLKKPPVDKMTKEVPTK
jgi:hypothetical protein